MTKPVRGNVYSETQLLKVTQKLSAIWIGDMFEHSTRTYLVRGELR